MIRINKPADPPAVLAGRGADAAQQLRDEFDADPEGFRSGEKKLDIKSAIYGHHTVVEAFAEAQHRKCCFCERKSLGDIEHYRPKSGYRQSPDAPLEKPGYYWLAYDWDNLLRACGPCNQRFKRSFFPLEEPANRARSPHDDVELERPLLLHPAVDDPAVHIGFRQEIAYPINDSPRARASIEMFGLIHEEIVESRRDFLGPLRALMDMRRVLIAEIDRQISQTGAPANELTAALSRINLEFIARMQPNAEYSSMARAAIESDL